MLENRPKELANFSQSVGGWGDAWRAVALTTRFDPSPLPTGYPFLSGSFVPVPRDRPARIEIMDRHAGRHAVACLRSLGKCGDCQPDMLGQGGPSSNDFG